MMSINRSRTFVSGLLIATALFLCLGHVGMAQTETEISFLYLGNPEDFEVGERLVEAFHAANPDIRVTLQFAAVDYYGKLLTMISGGTAPDVFWIDGTVIPSFAIQDTMLDLSPFIDRSTVLSRDEFFAPVLEMFTYNGGLWALPSDVSTVGLFYNADRFDQYGMTYPDASWTWSDFRDVSMKLTRDTNNDGEPDQFGAVIEPRWWFQYFPWLWQNGADVFNESMTESVIASPQAIEATQFWADLINVDRAAPTLAQAAQMGGTGRVFIDGIAAMYQSGPWEIPNFRKAVSFEWDLAEPPRRLIQASTFNSGAYAISNQTKNPEAAWRFVEFLAGPIGQAEMTASGLAIPAYRPVAAEAYSDPALPPRNGRAFMEIMGYARPAPITPEFGQVLGAISAGLSSVWAGEAPASNGLLEVQSVLNGILGQAP